MPKSQKLNAELKGLITNVGDLLKPPGATNIVDNFDLPAVGFLVQRRGINNNDPVGGFLQSYAIGGGAHNNVFKLFSTPFWGDSTTPAGIGSWMFLHRGFTYPDRLASIRSGNSAISPVDMLMPDAASGTAPSELQFPRYGVTGQPNVQSRLFSYNKNSFIVAKPAPARLETADTSTGPEGDGKLSYAGMPRPPGIAWEQQTGNELLPTSGAAGADPTFWLQPDYAVGYRVTFSAKDKQGVWRESAPSGKYIIANSSDYAGFSAGKEAAPILRYQIPYMTNTYLIPWSTQSNTFRPLRIKIYRTISVALSTGLPDDEYYLAYEGELSDADITNGYVTVTDYTPEFGLTDTAYFNSINGGDIATGLVAPSQGAIGLAAENDRPPFSMDGAMFQNCAFYANVTPPKSLTISIVAVGTAGLVLKAGDILYLASSITGPVSITAVAGVPAATQFHIHDTLIPNSAWSLRRTCENICAAFNKFQKNAIATYIGDLSNPENAGKIYFENCRIQDTTLYFQTSYGTPVPFIVPAPTLGTGTWYGQQITNGNGLAISKPNIPDAVPPVNYTLIGGNQFEIIRVVSTSDALFIFLTQGVWVCRGTGPTNFVFTEFDPSFKLLSPEMVTVLNDQIYAWGQQGVYRFSVGSGVEPLDLAIKNYTSSIQQYNRQSGGVAFNGWVAAQPNWNRVMFWFPDGIDEASPPATPGIVSRALVYHADTNAWTTYSAPILLSGGTTARYQYLNAVYRQWDQTTFFLGNPGGLSLSGFATRYLLAQNPTALFSLFNQADQNLISADTIAITSTVQWQAVIPNPGGLAHWSDFEYYTQPYLYGVDGPLANVNQTNIQIAISSDLGKTTLATVAAQPTTDKGRIILDTESGYATRQTVRIEVTGALYMFNGFSFLLRPLMGLNTR